MQRLVKFVEECMIMDFCYYTEVSPEGCEVVYKDDLDTGESWCQVVDAAGHGDGSGQWQKVLDVSKAYIQK